MEQEHKKHVMIVEDSPDLQALVGYLLKREGFMTTKALNGQEALQLLKSMVELPCLILLDLMMPVMDGYTFREEQGKDPRLAAIPVVVMTADAHPDTAKVQKMRVQELMYKPVDVGRLLEITSRCCS